MPGFPVHHQLPELAQTHVHRVGDAIQPSHPLSSPYLGLHGVAKSLTRTEQKGGRNYWLDVCELDNGVVQITK